MDKELLLRPRFKRETIEIEGVGTITVQALSREQLLSVGTDLSALETEQRALAAAMVDPPMTVEDIAAWQAASPAEEMSEVIDVVYRLSGIARGQDKEQYKSV
jgi:hypothetical protein